MLGFWPFFQQEDDENAPLNTKEQLPVAQMYSQYYFKDANPLSYSLEMKGLRSTVAQAFSRQKMVWVVRLFEQ